MKAGDWRLYLEIQQRVCGRFVRAVGEVFGVTVAEPSLDFPPSVDLGKLSITSPARPVAATKVAASDE